ncbi:tRNA uridine-5-carboxymethylaminomethyl(34) synthesis GTPase MnmE [Treponema putidum]|uniref:tRNA modification GTPase MnmE n=1 Tax=Treponema putidum TaxID=221027 RepID=A0AAE9SHM5_9SPIR|nr:tRNA uridine-5-carboxymethylaminomethyl(34) synthesis GTPase MnmE [Treponema putidum]UTY29188.1 tRNA uridine-5-carboxymethylaminomethyl(34) synthesis GTPase MnmE [Treponema putidum]UTY31586.1 tRNA uridine-5-carboxymethylaminomethyl(34) synthesis GTPase MnmE [Treponema putidum]UTY34038.1 tRNA uridine-5-carboxymethylaminomethyl(34) synthesis GTPase MnmE [Treponema putidum]
MQIGKYALDDPIAAIATALSPAALGIVRTSGKGAIDLASVIFSRPQKLTEAKGNTILHGWVLDPESKKEVDEVMACVYREPKSFTGEDSVEFICHGGTAVVLKIYRLLIENGFRAAEGGEFTFRAFANGKADLTRAEAVNEIINSKTDINIELAAGRLSGNLFSGIGEIKKELIAAIAAADVEIEYPEDEETTGGAFSPDLILRIIEPLKKLADSWAAEKIFIQGAKVVLAGRTNAGKSSLFNALLKEDRAIVSDIHGTTRDWLEASLNFNGIPVSLYDTAGIRYTKDSIEAIGVERSLEMSRNADLILYLCDPKDILSAGSLNKDDSEFIKNAKAPVITVITKEDLIDTESKEKIKEILKAEKIKYPIIISSKASNGIKALSEKAYALLAKNTGSSDFSKTASLGSERQRDAVQKALDVLKTAYQNAVEGFPLDLIVEDLEEALSFLGEITGEVRSDDILDKVFSGFCVGK